jgi:hypothetical protein
MEARLRSWRQQIKQHRMWAAVIIVTSALVIALIVVVVLGYWLNWQWVGVSAGNSKITTTTTATEQPPAKTLWDWLNLLGVLAIPVVVGIGAAWFTTQQSKASEATNQRQHDTELEISTDNQRESALQAYIDKISELLLKEHLGDLTPDGKLKPEYEAVRNIARVRTLTVLRDLKSDAERKESILEILYESGLIDMGKHIIDLSGADLSQADVSGADLSRADLSGANLRKANLSNAILFNANFSNAILEEANFNKSWVTREQLEQAKSLKGATMPDGSIHP